MPQGLHLSQRLTQSLVLAPQLQQSLALLQAPTLELKALVEQELQQNPVLEESASSETELEEKEVKDADEKAEAADPAEPPADVEFDPGAEKDPSEPVDDFQAEFERLVQLDQEWRDHFAQTNLPMRASAEDEEKRQFMFDSLVAKTSLQEMLLEQARESSLPEELWRVAELVIGSIDDYGYFRPWFAETIRITARKKQEAYGRVKLGEPELHYFHPRLDHRGSPKEYANRCFPEREYETDTEAVVRYFESQEAAEQYARKQWPEGKYLVKSRIEDLTETTGVPPATLLQVLNVIQTFDPAGVGARDLRECLLLQLERSGRKDTLEYRIVSDFMEAVGKRRIPEIARGTGADVDEVQEAMEQLKNLEPHPCRGFVADDDQYILPEVFVRKSGDEYVVTTNNEQIPHLRISNTYKDLMASGGNSPEVRNYIREKIRAGKFLIKSLHQRQQTILNIANEIVRRQREFLAKGVAALKPLTMVQVAQVVGVHETTVSRAVSGKYIQTPQGIFEMKYFFTAGIQTSHDDGAPTTSMSNTSVKNIIDEIFKAEDTAKPLSDQEVVRMLKEKGIVIARRTVAKYRSELNILPSNLRKVY